jgi:protein tyrosine/serine phosphatase
VQARTTIRGFGFLFCVVSLVFAAENPAAHVRNFDKVSDHIYRGGDPTAVGLTELGAMGIKIDLDLRETSAATKVEKGEAEKLGIKYINVPMKPLSAPTDEEVEHAIAILGQTSAGPIFVHCRRGKDRTGTVIACYRIQHDGWSNKQALAEARKHGMSFAERGMQHYILHFNPVTVDEASKVKPPISP